MKHRRAFENYEEIALDLRTAKQLLYQASTVFGRVYYSNKIMRICRRLEELISKTEIEMFEDWPDRANKHVFYGGEDYRLDIRRHPEYIYSSFGYSSCDLVDAFAILGRDGIVLLSSDARVSFEEDAVLREIAKNMIERKKSDDQL